MDNATTISIDSPEQDALLLVLIGGDGTPLDREEVHYHGPVDNILLTTIDNLLNRNRVHKFALKTVQVGQGIDKNSSLYRIVQSFTAAISVAEKRP